MKGLFESMSNKGMKIGTGKNYDLSEVSKKGLTSDDIEKMNANAKKLINIYNIDGQDGLTKIELAYAMDGFLQADTDDNGRLSDNELEAYAQQINREKNLSGTNEVSGKDLKAFLKDVRKFTKDDEKESRATITSFENDIARKLSKDQYVAVKGQYDIYQKDGKYYKIIRNEDGAFLKRVKQENGTYVPMTYDDLSDEYDRELKDEMAQKAQSLGYTPVDGQDGVYRHSENGKDLYYIYDRENKTFVRAKQSGSDNQRYIRMTGEEITAEAAAEAIENDRIAALKTPKAYTVQLGESFDDLIKRSLTAQGIDVTDENIALAKEEFIQNNPNAVHTNRRGVQYLYAADVVQIAGNLEDKNNADEVKQAYRAQQAERARAARGSSPQTSESSSTTEEGVTIRNLGYYDNNFIKIKEEYNTGAICYMLEDCNNSNLVCNNSRSVAEAVGLTFVNDDIYQDNEGHLFVWKEGYFKCDPTSSIDYKVDFGHSNYNKPVKISARDSSLEVNRDYKLTKFGELRRRFKNGDIVTYTFDSNHRIKTIKFEYTDPNLGHRRTCHFDYGTIVPVSPYDKFNSPFPLGHSKDQEDYLSKQYGFIPNKPFFI